MNVATVATPMDMERDEIIKSYAPLVKIIASRLAIRLPAHIDINDLISVGITGLIEAIDRYDPSRGVKMETYISFRIKGAMLDELRRVDWVPRSVRQKVRHFEEEYLRVESKLGRMPTEEEMAEALGKDEVGFQKFLREINGAAILSLEDMGFHGDGDERNIMECIADPKGEDPFKSLHLKETKKLLAGVIDELPKKERLVLSLYYYEDLNLKEIGKVLEVTESRVCQLHGQAILKLKAKLKMPRHEDGWLHGES